MAYHVLLRFASLIVDVFASIRPEPDDKDLPIALHSQQFRAIERKT